MNRTTRNILLLALIASGTAAGVVSAAADDVGFDDFDDNSNFISRVFSPDNDANGSFNGLFNDGDASRFDRFGIVNRDAVDTNPGELDNIPLALPFDVVDDSANGFATDNFGVLKTTDFGNNVVLLADSNNSFTTANGGTGAVQIDWTFDISGFENLQLSVDFAAVGNFEPSDVYAFGYTVDGGAFETAFVSTVAEDTFYTVTMEGGETYGRYTNPFFDDDPTGAAPDDNPVAEDADGNLEFQDYVDPLLINGVQLNNDFQTITAPISGTGSSLALTFQGLADASLEYFLFDNILITGDPISSLLLGDLSLDGVISGADITPFVAALSDQSQYQLDNNLTEAEFLQVADINQDGFLTGADIQPFVTLLGGGGTSLSASQIALLNSVPEPTSAGLLAATGLIMIRRRRKV